MAHYTSPMTPSVADTVSLSADGIARRFGFRRIFRDVSLTLNRGTVLAIIGPNGAGKTTLLRVLAGLLRPSLGSIERHGRVGLVGHSTMTYEALTAKENLRFAARLWGVKDLDRIDSLLTRLGLWKWRDQIAGTFSRGMLQRLSIARSLLHEPDILLLDEPLTGLDEPGVEVVLDVLAELVKQGRSMVIVTHQFDRVASLATDVGYLVQGVLNGPETAVGRSSDSVTATYRRLLADA